MDFVEREDVDVASLFLTRFVAGTCAFAKVFALPWACFASLPDVLCVDAAVKLADCFVLDLTLSLLDLTCGAVGGALSFCATGRCFPLVTGAAIAVTAKVMLLYIKMMVNKANPNFERTMPSPS